MQEMQETVGLILGWEDLLKEGWQPTPVLLLGKSHGQRILLGYSPSGHKELATTKATEQRMQAQN